MSDILAVTKIRRAVIITRCLGDHPMRTEPTYRTEISFCPKGIAYPIDSVGADAAMRTHTAKVDEVKARIKPPTP
jgi:hypothetical protein